MGDLRGRLPCRSFSRPLVLTATKRVALRFYEDEVRSEEGPDATAASC